MKTYLQKNMKVIIVFVDQSINFHFGVDSLDYYLYYYEYFHNEYDRECDYDYDHGNDYDHDYDRDVIFNHFFRILLNEDQLVYSLEFIKFINLLNLQLINYY